MYPSVWHPASHLHLQAQKEYFRHSDSSDHVALYDFLQKQLPILRAATHHYSYTSHYYRDTSAQALRKPNCGRATNVLSYLLRRHNFATRKLESTTLNTHLFNSTYLYTGHAVLEVQFADGSTILVDPTYSQFLSLSYLCYPLPNEEIMALPTSKVHEGMAFIRKLREQHLEEDIFLEYAPIADMSDEHLSDYFAALWNVANYEPSEDDPLEVLLERFYHKHKNQDCLAENPIHKMAKLIGYEP